MERRYWSNEEKLKIVKEALETGNCSVVADRYQVSKSLVARWVRAYKEQTNPDLALELGAHSRQQRRQLPYNPDAYKKSLAENDRLKKLLGEKDLEIDILRDLLKKPTLSGRKNSDCGQMDQPGLSGHLGAADRRC